MYGLCYSGSDRTSKNNQEILYRSIRLVMIVFTILLSDLSLLTFTEAATPTPPPFRNSSSPHPSPSTSFASSSSSSTGGTGVESHVEATDFVGTPMCRDRDGYFPPKDFELWTCGYCLNYLYNVTLVRVVFHDRLRLLLFTNGTKQIIGTGLPDVTNSTDVSKVCKALQAAGQDCQRWVDCCRAAQDCCRRQRAASASLPALGKLGMDRGAVQSDGKYCPATWDGYRCWDRTPAGSTVSTHCASYIEHASTDALAHKVCQDNGTWFVNPVSKKEWTDYTGCIVLDHFWALFWVGVVCNVVSLMLLLPACFIFLYFRSPWNVKARTDLSFRSLRSQHRIKLHTCLFLSYIVTNVLMIMWEVIVVKDRLISDRDKSVLHNNSVGCRILHTLTRYAWTTNFMWMFLEGFHLYRLMVHAFAVPRSLLGFYIGGYSIPWIPTIIYVSIRATSDSMNTRCWVGNAGGFEWIIYVPIIICLAGNIFFLTKILYVMLTQLQSHPNEPSSYRRAAKAAAILVPLFGLQVVMVIARPQPANYMFEIFSKIVTSTQGALVAIGFCYLNGEVLTVIRNALPRSMRSRSLLRSDQRSTMSTQFTTDAGSRSHHHHHRASSATTTTTHGTGTGSGGAGYIPLSTIGDEAKVKGNGELEKLHNGSV